jgi:hypothetical protein
MPPSAISAVIWSPFHPTILHHFFTMISFHPPPPLFLLFVLSMGYPDQVRIVVKDEEEALWFPWMMTVKFSSISAAGGTPLSLERDIVIVVRESRRIGPRDEEGRVVWLDDILDGLEEDEPEGGEYEDEDDNDGEDESGSEGSSSSWVTESGSE